MDPENLTRKIIEFYERLSSWEQAVVKGTELTPGQMHTIEIVGHSGPLRMKELAEKVGVTTGTLTVTVDNLERLGLLERKPHASDRRSFLVALTARGNELFARHHHFHVKLTQEMISSLTAEEAHMFEQILDKVIHHF